MNTRSEWNTNPNNPGDIYYTAEETLNDVIENFNIRRMNSNEGKDITVNGVMERCIVQTSSNPLRELDDQRKIHCPMSLEVHRGDYVQYEGATWLITTNVANIDGAYQSARMSMCNWELKWQNSSGDIISRWAYITSASKYNDGEDGNRVITLGSDQLCIQIPIDDESLAIERDKKFFIDNSTTDPTVYELTGKGNVINTYAGHGVTSWIVKECAYSPTAEDLEHGVCEYFEPTPTPPVPSGTWYMVITCPNTTIKPDNVNKVITAQLYDENNVPITEDIEYSWTVTSDISQYITTTIDENEITVSLSDNCDDIGEEIVVSCSSRYTGQYDDVTLIVKEVF